jgi:hypothetical protein
MTRDAADGEDRRRRLDRGASAIDLVLTDLVMPCIVMPRIGGLQVNAVLAQRCP